MITESELRDCLIARIETSTTVKPQDLPMAQRRGAAGAYGAKHYSGRGEGRLDRRVGKKSERTVKENMRQLGPVHTIAGPR